MRKAWHSQSTQTSICKAVYISKGFSCLPHRFNSLKMFINTPQFRVDERVNYTGKGNFYWYDPPMEKVSASLTPKKTTQKIKDHKVLGGLTILLPCGCSSGPVSEQADESRFFTSSEESHDVSGSTEYSQLPTVLQDRSLPGLRAQTSTGQTSFPPEMSWSDNFWYWLQWDQAKFSRKFNPQRGPGCLLGKANVSVAVSAFHVDWQVFLSCCRAKPGACSFSILADQLHR